jgi:hypothetical protein
MNSNNVIAFPSTKRVDAHVTIPQSLEEVEDAVDIVREAHIQQTLEQVVPMLFDNLSLAGFQPINENDFLKDGALVVESVRAFMHKLYGMDHPLQYISEHLFEESAESGLLSVSDGIKITISKHDEQE